MSLEYFIQNYGYIAIFIGTIFEGETILIMGGLAAHLGYMHLSVVLVAAFAGTLVGDQFFFFIGRYRGKIFIEKHDSFKPRLEKVNYLLNKYDFLFIIGFRFLYGLRTVCPFAVGMSKLPVERFMILNFIGASIWSIVIGLCGYLFGYTLENLIGDLKKYEIHIFVFVALTGTIVWFILYMVHNFKKKKRANGIKND